MVFRPSTDFFWNCNLEGADAPYSTPFITGDDIPLQLVSKPLPSLTYTDADFDTTQQVGAIKVKIVEADDINSVILDKIDLFGSEYHVGSETRGGVLQQYMSMVIYTGLLPSNLECFRVVIEVPSSSFDAVSEPFKRVECNEGTVRLKSEYRNKWACDGSLYAMPSDYNGGFTTPYQPDLRVRADWQFTGTTAQVVENDNGKVISRVLFDKYELRLLEPIPPYIAERLRAVVFGEDLKTAADGEVYNSLVLAADFTKSNETSRMYLPELAFTRRCVLKAIKCL